MGQSFVVSLMACFRIKRSRLRFGRQSLGTDLINIERQWDIDCLDKNGIHTVEDGVRVDETAAAS